MEEREGYSLRGKGVKGEGEADGGTRWESTSEQSQDRSSVIGAIYISNYCLYMCYSINKSTSP
jgi:hypothetical protein